MQIPLRMAILLLVALLLAALLLAACTAARGGEAAATLSGRNQEGKNGSEESVAMGSVDENSPADKAAPIQTEKANFALG